MRTVAETAAAGQLVGDPVTAEDEDANDVLTYTLAGGSGKFVIDRATGQISVAKGAGPKFNVTTGDDGGRIQRCDKHCHRLLRMYQPSCGNHRPYGRLAAPSMVTINVTQVDEPPIFTVTSTGESRPIHRCS